MIEIKAAEFESRNVHEMVDHIYNTPILTGKCMRISMCDRNKHLMDVAHEGAAHISTTSTDYIYKVTK